VTTTNQQFNDLLDLMKILTSSNQEAPGWIETGLRKIHVRFGSPGRPQNPTQQAAADRIQGDIDNLFAEGILFVYYFALFEHHLPLAEWDKLLNPDVVQRLRAYRHIRHTFAHGLNGIRSTNKKDRSAFDDVMASSDPLPGVRHDATHILEVRGALRGDLIPLLDRAAKQAVVAAATP